MQRIAKDDSRLTVTHFREYVTYMESGYEYYNEITNITDALGHDFSIEPDTTDEEHYIAPTATEDGLMYCQCSRCGEWSTEGVIIPALGVVTTTTIRYLSVSSIFRSCRCL